MAAYQELLLYRKRGECPLCDIAAEALAPIARRLNLAVNAVDIESDAELFDRYQFDVPVVLFGGVEVARGRVVPPVVEARLREIRDIN